MMGACVGDFNNLLAADLGPDAGTDLDRFGMFSRYSVGVWNG